MPAIGTKGVLPRPREETEASSSGASWFVWGPADIILVSFVFCASALISWQGWRCIFAHDDSVPLIQSATALLRSGVIPSRGLASNYSSFTAPGTVWLYLPGVAIFSDYRLFELIGALLLHLGTLIGLFTLVRFTFSRAAAFIAVLIYAFSPIGIVLASTLQPRGHPVFSVWFVLWLVLWQSKRDARYLWAAVFTFVVGMFVFMEIAPLFPVLFAVYYLYRPPLWTKWVPVVAAISLLIWLPYIRFEWTRGFRDVASLVFQIDLMPRDHGRLLCDASLREEVLKHAPVAKSTFEKAEGFVRTRPRAALTGLVSNFGLHHRLPWGRRPASSESTGGHIAVGLPGAVGREAISVGWVSLAVLSIVLFAVAAFVVVLMAVTILIDKVNQRRETPRIFRGVRLTDAQIVFFLGLTIPWATLILIAEYDAARRYLFIWPLQIVLLAYFATDLLARWAPSVWVRAAQFALLALFVANPTVILRVQSWRARGWSGPDSDLYRAANFAAEQVRHEGRSQAAIGYSFPWASGPADWQFVRDGGDDAYNAVDPQYRIGFEVDYVLKQRFGVESSEKCPEGISPADEFVIAYDGPDLDPPEYKDLRKRIFSELKQVGEFGEFAVLGR